MLEAAESEANKIHREIKQYKVRDDILKMNSICKIDIALENSSMRYSKV